MEKKIFTYLDQLESESIYIIREVVSEFRNPVMLYSIGKDSSVMLHLARKAFYPGKIPFPLLHVDTGWKFSDMYDFRDHITKKLDIELIIHINQDGISAGINPFLHGSTKYTDIMKTEGLKQAINKYSFDAAFGGARRDEEKSRSKERIYSFRNELNQWNPKQQRPELWNLYNGQMNIGENIRVFPLSNWTELDIWKYIYSESIDIVPLYFSASRPILERNNMLLMVNDNRIIINEHETVQNRMVRFRTLGCWPLTSAQLSQATTVPEIIEEMLLTNYSERIGRAIDNDKNCSMELKKRQGYF